jgi:hypothetical protein
MEPVIGGLLLVMFVLGFGPAVRGTAAGLDSIENPGRQETPAEREQANSDMWRLLVLIVGVFGLMFALKLGAL